MISDIFDLFLFLTPPLRGLLPLSYTVAVSFLSSLGILYLFNTTTHQNLSTRDPEAASASVCEL